MKSIILAAGEGTRLRPLTEKSPKCLVPLFGKSLLERQIDLFHKCGIENIVVVTGYMHDKFDFPNITYYHNSKFSTTNMVETLFQAKQELDGDVIVSYGDIIFEEKVLQSIINSNQDISVAVDQNWKELWECRFANPLDDAESLILDSDDYILEIGQKIYSYDKICSQFIGLIKFQNNGTQFLKEFYDKAAEDTKSSKNPLNANLPFEKSYMTDLLNAIIKSGKKIKAVKINNGWLELDSVNDYDVYNNLFKTGKLGEFINLENCP